MIPSVDRSQRSPSGGRRLGVLLMMCLVISPGMPLTAGADAGRAAQEEGFPSISGPCNLVFPRDHGEHPEHRTEWWYYTGNLAAENGSRYGYQLTFFRSRMRPAASRSQWPRSPSAWRASQLYLAHAALTDIAGRRFFHAETLARGALGMAGVREDPPSHTVFVRNWTARIDPEAHDLHATAGDFALELSLIPLKPPVLHGVGGYSLKGISKERASCYYSLTRLRTRGVITVGGARITVQGDSWMDHEYSSAPLEEGLVGWDWFSLQLSDGSELMIYLLRDQAGTMSPASSGTFVRASGDWLSFGRDEIRVDVLSHWASSRSKARYPSRWRLRVPALDLDLLVTPNLPDQELITPESTRITYWEGSVAAVGTMHQQPLQGQGYVELTGYAHPLDARF